MTDSFCDHIGHRCSRNQSYVDWLIELLVDFTHMKARDLKQPFAESVRVAPLLQLA